jgi:release factor glutamine methyltransferase
VTAATLSDLLRGATSRLGDPVAARWVVGEAAGLEAAPLLLGGAASAPPGAAERVEEMLGRLDAGEPLQHVLGHWGFRTLDLLVDPRALVPRPETELVTGCVLDELARMRAERAARGGAGGGSTRRFPVVLDLGTGSGAISCAIVAEDGDARVVAIERSPDALELARENRARLHASAAARLFLAAGDWYDGVAGLLARTGLGPTVDCIVSNPPYIAESEWSGLDPVVRDHDPYDALVAGPTGLEGVEAVVTGAPGLLARRGVIVVEIAPWQAGSARDLARAAGARDVAVEQDLAGRARCVRARW